MASQSRANASAAPTFPGVAVARADPAAAVAVAHVCDGLPFTRYMMAGAVAGMVEHVAMFPVDTIKTRMQVEPALLAERNMYQSVFTSVNAILRHEGVRGLYRGVAAMALGAGPAHAVYFTTYEKTKRHLMENGFVTNASHAAVHPAAAGASGALATVVSDAVMNPMDVVKQRLQLPGSTYHSVWDCVVRVQREEGVRAFFRSYPTTLVMNIPYTAVHFAVYESVKQFLDGDDEELEGRLLTHVTAGGSAGGIAAALTTPLDVVKTRLQTDCALRSMNSAGAKVCAVGGERCAGAAGAAAGGAAAPVLGESTPAISHCLRRIVQAEGVAALFRGLAPRVMFHTPAAAICWTAYESMKSILSDIDSRFI